MAKSFKQLPTSAVQPAKRTSEKDILDFLEQDWLTPTPPEELTSTTTSSNTAVTASSVPSTITGHDNTSNNATNNIHNTDNIGNTDTIDNTNLGSPSLPMSSVKKSPRSAKSPRRKQSSPLTEKKSANKSPLGGDNITAVTGVPVITDVTYVNQTQDVHDITHVHYADDNIQEHDVDVRQTFVLGQEYLERLKNFVHTRRISGQYDFTQKQALHQALNLLFATAQIEERPLQIRQKEELRRQQIRKGKLK